MLIFHWLIHLPRHCEALSLSYWICRRDYPPPSKLDWVIAACKLSFSCHLIVLNLTGRISSGGGKLYTSSQLVYLSVFNLCPFLPSYIRLISADPLDQCVFWPCSPIRSLYIVSSVDCFYLSLCMIRRINGFARVPFTTRFVFHCRGFRFATKFDSHCFAVG